jgi:hypothetical protein
LKLVDACIPLLDDNILTLRKLECKLRLMRNSEGARRNAAFAGRFVQRCDSGSHKSVVSMRDAHGLAALRGTYIQLKDSTRHHH